MNGVSVITSAYRAQETIGDYLEGFSEQVGISSLPVEFLIGVDGCPETLQAIKGHRGDRPHNVRVFNFYENCGTYAVFNNIVQYAKYDHIIRFDADDVPFVNFIQKFREVMSDEAPPDIVRFLSHDELMAFGTIGFNRSILNQMGGYHDWKCSADYEFILRATRMKYNISYVTEKIFQRGVSDTQLSSDTETSLTSEYRAELNKKAQTSTLEYVAPIRVPHGEFEIEFLPFEDRPLLGVVMIVKNEQKVLRNCLESIKDADEIVIVDTGSKDKTVEIAKEYTDKVSVGEFQWCWDYEKARNFALNKCTANYLLSIDADEVLEKDGIATLKRYINMSKCGDWAFALKMRCGDMHFNGIRMWKNHRGLRFKGVGHEVITRIPPDVITDVTIDFGHSPAHAEEPGRMFLVMQNAVGKEPHNSRSVFYLAREYAYHGDFNTAIRMYDWYLAISTYKAEIAEAHLQKAKCHIELSNAPSAKDSALAAIGVNPSLKEAWRLLETLSEPCDKPLFAKHAEIADNEGVLFVRGN